MDAKDINRHESSMMEPMEDDLETLIEKGLQGDGIYSLGDNNLNYDVLGTIYLGSPVLC